MGNANPKVVNEWLELHYRPELKFLGQGSLGSTYKTFCKNDSSKAVAIKIYKTEIEDDYNLLVKEVTNTMNLEAHPNIVKLERINNFVETDQKSGKKLYYAQIAMEFAEGSLNKIIDRKAKKGNVLSLGELYFIAFDCLSALKYLSSKQMGHLNLKPGNILYFEKEKLFKLTFIAGGFQLRSSQSNIMKTDQTFLSSEYYKAPELHKLIEDPNNEKKLSSSAADVYSLGMLLLECLGIKNEEAKFKGEIWKRDEKLHDEFTEANLFQPLQNKGNLDQDFIDFLRKMSAFDPNSRCSIEDALQYFANKLDKNQTVRDFDEKIEETTLEGDVKQINENWKKKIDEKEYALIIKPKDGRHEKEGLDFWRGITKLTCPKLSSMVSITIELEGMTGSWKVMENFKEIIKSNNNLKHVDIQMTHSKDNDWIIADREIRYYIYMGEIKEVGDRIFDVFGDSYFQDFISSLVSLPLLESFFFVSRFSNIGYDCLRKCFDKLSSVKTLSCLKLSFSRNVCFDKNWKDQKVTLPELNNAFNQLFVNLKHRSFFVGDEY